MALGNHAAIGRRDDTRFFRQLFRYIGQYAHGGNDRFLWP